MPDRSLTGTQVMLLLSVPVTLVLCGAFWIHLDGLNGPAYWSWTWRQLPSAAFATAAILALIPWLAAHRYKSRPVLAMMLLMLSFWLLEAAVFRLGFASPTGRSSTDVLMAATRDHDVTGYFSDASSLRSHSLREVLSHYPQSLRRMSPHGGTKGPGPVLLYWIAQRLARSSNAAALVTALLIAGLSALVIPATALLARTLEQDRGAGFEAAAWIAILPAFVGFAPGLDRLYGLFTVALLLTWFRALRTGGWLVPAFAAALAITVFFSYSLLVLGFTCAGMMVIAVIDGATTPRDALSRATGSIACFAFLYAVLWAASGYSLPAAYQAAWRNQQGMLAALRRPWPDTIAFDLYDFALGSAFVTIAVVLRAALRRGAATHRWLARLALALPVVVATSGLLAAETARVWLFLLPVIAIPVGAELSSAPAQERIALKGAVLLLSFSILRNVTF
ncbi:MAG: hypothetical protein ABI837_07305 [Acidobacteriota bacterium]